MLDTIARRRLDPVILDAPFTASPLLETLRLVAGSATIREQEYPRGETVAHPANSQDLMPRLGGSHGETGDSLSAIRRPPLRASARTERPWRHPGEPGGR